MSKRTSKMISKRDTSDRYAPFGITDHFTMRLRLKESEEEIMIFTTGRIPRLERSENRGNEGSSSVKIF